MSSTTPRPSRTRRTTPSWSAAATTAWSTPATWPRPGCARSCSSSATSSAVPRSPRSCVPGFSFTTFSYALSLLRPEIIQELDLVKHGFMPLMMPSSFHPTGDGDYLLLGDDHGQNMQEIRRHSPHDADAYDRYHHDLDRVVQAVQPLFDNAPPERLRQGPRGPGRRRVAARPPRRRRAEGDARRRAAAHRQRLGLARGLLRARGGQGLPRVLEHHRLEGRADVARAPAWCCCSTRWASTTGTSGRGRSTRAATAASRRCSRGRPRRTARRSGSERRSRRVLTQEGRAVGVALEDGTEFRAPVVVSALDPRRTFLELVDPRELPGRPGRQRRADEVPRRLGEGQLRARRPAGLPRAARHRRPLRRLPQHRADDRVRRARLRRREVRLVQRAALHRRRDPVGRRPRHGAARQARDVVLRAVRAVRAARQRLGDRARAASATRRRPSSSRTSPASATWCCTARW